MLNALWLVTIVALTLAIGFGASMSVAGKSHQFTGTVKSVDASTLTVRKSAKKMRTFSIDKDTKGTAKVGDKVTVSCTLVATQIEAASAPPPAVKRPAN